MTSSELARTAARGRILTPTTPTRIHVGDAGARRQSDRGTGGCLRDSGLEEDGESRVFVARIADSERLAVVVFGKNLEGAVARAIGVTVDPEAFAQGLPRSRPNDGLLLLNRGILLRSAGEQTAQRTETREWDLHGAWGQIWVMH